MFENFSRQTVELEGARLYVRVGGSGPAVLLLHGHPRTHATWHRVAPLLARKYTVVCPDLPGFGRSSIPDDQPGHVGSSKRAKAAHCLALMRRLGFETFHLAGHDRGSYTAFRLAMDHPSAVLRLILMDSVPILEALERCDQRFARQWWHWFFFAQAEKPERAINADPERWYGGTAAMGKEAYADYLRAIHDPAVVHGMIEDYRAGLSIDHAHDAEDRAAGRKLTCPTRLLWSLRDDLEDLYGDVLAVWRPWCDGPLSGRGLPCGHHMAEEVPDLVAEEIAAFVA